MDVKQALLNLSASKLKKAVALKERIETLQAELGNLLMDAAPPHVQRVIQAKKTMSAAARKRISDTLKARWAKIKAGKAKGS